MRLVRSVRQAASRAKHQLFPSPAIAAWRHACRTAAHTPRYTAGEIALDGYRVAYADLLTLCPQWHDIFVAGSLHFDSNAAAPRILDCGANVGLASLYFKRLYPAARITAYEPDPSLAALCRRNLAANGAADVDVEAVAVWCARGAVRFQQEGADSGAIEGTSAGLRAKAITVPALRLRDVIAAERIDLLKLDIEGAETAVLADCAEALDNVEAIVMELHEFDPAERRTPIVMRLLGRAGFLVSMSRVEPLPWRQQARPSSPFPGDSPAWAATLRAWRA
jgi:FkbM family methyltransferase